MTPLRQRMIEDMQLRNLAQTTQRSYIHYVADFALYFNRSPEHLDLEAVRQYQLHLLQDRKLSACSVNTFISAVRFLYLETLEMPWQKENFTRTRVEEKLPVVLSTDEVRRLFEHIPGVKNRAALMLCYGAGLRVSEAVAVKIADIDSERKLVRVEQGKGGKDRYSMLSPALLEVLRAYWRIVRPSGDWLFPSWRSERHLSAGSLQSACLPSLATGRAAPNASVPTRCATALPPACWRAASTRASFRSCSAIAASIPRLATPGSLRLRSPSPPALWINSWPGLGKRLNVNPPKPDERANSRVGRHLSTIRPRLPAGPSFAPVSASLDAGHRDLPHGRIGRRGRMVRPLPIHSHPLPFLPQPSLPQVPGRGAGKMAPAAPVRVVAQRVLPRGLHAPGAHRRHRFLQQRARLRLALRRHRRNPAHHRRRPQASGRGNRLLRRVA